MNSTSNRLYIKIATTLLLLLIVLGIGFAIISAYTSRRYFQETNQRLYGNVAEYLVRETKPLKGGEPDSTAIHDIMHSMMIINPSAEVYILNTEGVIKDHVAPYKKVKLEKVDLAPVKDFIASECKSYILGDDPRHPGEKKVFSAAPIKENDKLTGYAYIILASEEQAAVASNVFGSNMLRMGVFQFALTLIGALLIGLLAFWFLMRNIRAISDIMRRFKEGDYQARIDEKSKGDLPEIADTYNSMADTIVDNIEQIKSVDRLRQELIANVSHDLRTPLAIMQGYIETLMMKKDSLSEADQNKYLGIVLNSSEQLSRLVSQLFEYSKLEANQIQPQKEPFFVAELAQDIYAKYQILAQDKGIKLELDAPKDLPLVFADVGLVERAIQNLMDNALKFTPEGGSVAIDLVAQDTGVEVKISDTGPGIPESEQSYIFERYRQTDNTKANGKGAGLGLAIVKKILELQNATIQVTSRPNEGATFWFMLPAYQA